MASTYLSRTFGTPTNSKKWTISFWMKRAMENNWDAIFGCDYDQGDSYYGVGSGGQGRHEIGLLEYHTSATSYGQGYTDASLRDCSAWYHIVFAYDSTQSTATDRGKTYINGVFANSTYSNNIPQNHDSKFNSNGVGMRIGCRSAGGGSAFFEGSLSHFHFIDGTAYDATPFGSTDSTTGEWKINTSPSVTYGNNGFFILKDGNSVTDQSGNSNNFTVGAGTLTNTEDCPSNVFATMNPLVKSGNSLTNGNLTVTQNSGLNYQNSISTLAVTKGKWYAECKLSNISGLYPGIGIIDVSENGASSGDDNGYFGTYDNPKGIALFAGGYYSTGNNNNASLTNNSTNDIIGIALDLDSATKNIKMYRNGTLITGSSVTPPDPDGGYAFGVTMHSSGSGAVAEWNFGNGYFGTTAVASAGTNASGIGIFEHDVPNGYTSLSTKGLNL